MYDLRDAGRKKTLGGGTYFQQYRVTNRAGDPMLITLFTDASYCMKTQVAAYAAWARTDGRTVRRAGVLREPVPDSSVAEAQALVNGLCFVVAALQPGANSRIIAQTD
jgi:ribonuclease HI